jgi:hypothetical protein
MMRRMHSTVAPLGCAALLFLFACVQGEGTSPTPGATAAPSPDAGPVCPGHGGRWATIVLYQEGKACRQVTGPARLTACRGEDITWRIYNHCGDPHTVRIDGFLFSVNDPGIPRPKDEDYESPPPSEAKPKGLFEGGRSTISLKQGEVNDLTLRVLKVAPTGFYKYFTILDAKPDADQQIEVP